MITFSIDAWFLAFVIGLSVGIFMGYLRDRR